MNLDCRLRSLKKVLDLLFELHESGFDCLKVLLMLFKSGLDHRLSRSNAGGKAFHSFSNNLVNVLDIGYDLCAVSKVLLCR